MLFWFNLSCLGDNKAYSYINTPEENTDDYAIGLL